MYPQKYASCTGQPRDCPFGQDHPTQNNGVKLDKRGMWGVPKPLVLLFHRFSNTLEKVWGSLGRAFSCPCSSPMWHSWGKAQCPQPEQGWDSPPGLCVGTAFLQPQLLRMCWLRVQLGIGMFLALDHLHLPVLKQREGTGRSKRKILRLAVKIFN